MQNSFEILKSSDEIDKFLVLLIILKDQLSKTLVDSDKYNKSEQTFKVDEEKIFLINQKYAKQYSNLDPDMFSTALPRASCQIKYDESFLDLQKKEKLLNNSLEDLINIVFLVINKSIDEKINISEFIDRYKKFDLDLLINIIPITNRKIEDSITGEEISKKIVEKFSENIEKFRSLDKYRSNG